MALKKVISIKFLALEHVNLMGEIVVCVDNANYENQLFSSARSIHNVALG